MRRNVNAAPAWAARRVGDVETHRQPPPAGARRKREEERGGPGPGDRAGEKGGGRGGGLSAELKYDPVVRSHSATTVTMRLTKRPYTCVHATLSPSSSSLGYKIVSCYGIADVTPTAYTNRRCTNKTLCVVCVLDKVVSRPRRECCSWYIAVSFLIVSNQISFIMLCSNIAFMHIINSKNNYSQYDLIICRIKI